MPLFTSKVPDRIDSSLRPICFGINKLVSADQAKQVRPALFKRYEHALYIMGQFSRLIYCDTGIIWKSMEAGLGMSSDILNTVITTYDNKYINERRAPLKSQNTGIQTTTKLLQKFTLPHESYALGPAPKTGTKYATYVCSPENVTCIVANTNAGNGRLLPKYNINSIFKDTDVIMAFKGSSTLIDFKHDFMSQLTGADLQSLIGPVTGIRVANTSNIVTGSFIKPLVAAWSVLMQALSDHVKGPNTRLFITGQSLGGAYCSLMGFILAEAISSKTGHQMLQNISSIHIVSFGSPTLMYAQARNTFNRHLDSGLVTLDRVVSQWQPTRSTALQGVLIGTTAGMVPGSLVGPQDGIPAIPYGFVHPGFRPLTLNIRPEANGRPYSLDNVRKFYGVNTTTRYRDPQSWPFDNEITDVNGEKIRSEVNFDTRNHPQITKIVTKITGTQAVYKDVDLPASPAELTVKGENPEKVQEGGSFFNRSQKNAYSKETQTHIPNYLSVEGNHRAHIFAHAEYLGMFYAGVFRFAGMLNPSPEKSGKCGFFEIYPTGVSIKYVDEPVFNKTKRGGKKSYRRITRRHYKGA